MIAGLFETMNAAMKTQKDAAGKTEWDNFLRTYVLDELPAVVKLLVAQHGWDAVKIAVLNVAREEGFWPPRHDPAEVGA